jgi:anion transporter
VGIIIALVLTKVLSTAEAFSGFINTNVIMVAGMFVVGAGLTKTSLMSRILSMVSRYKDSPRKTVLISCVSISILAIITSGPAAMSVMLPLLLAISEETGISRSKLLYPAACVAHASTGLTILGQGAANLTWNEVMLNAGGTIAFNIWDFTIARLPLLIITIAYMVFIGQKILPDNPNSQFGDNIQQKDVSSKLSPTKEKIAIGIVVLTVLGIIFSNQINVSMYLCACIGAVLMVVCGIMKDAEALSSIHLPTIFLFAGVLALSDALKVTGAGDLVADWIIRALGNTTNPYVIMAVFFLIPVVLTQLMSNTAVIAIFIPLVAAAAVKIGVDPRAVVMGIIVSSNISVLSPMASPVQALVMETGGYKIQDYFKTGIAFVIVNSAVAIWWLPTLFPFY